MAILYSEDQPALHKILSKRGGGEEREKKIERGLPLKFNPVIPFFRYTERRNSSMLPTNTMTRMSPAAAFPRVQVDKLLDSHKGILKHIQTTAEQINTVNMKLSKNSQT